MRQRPRKKEAPLEAKVSKPDFIWKENQEIKKDLLWGSENFHWLTSENEDATYKDAKDETSGQLGRLILTKMNHTMSIVEDARH